jgi:tetratricopeptide (TPR) repeat protein
VQISLPHLVYDAIKSSPGQFRTDIFLGRHLLLYPCRTVLFYRRANFLTLRGSDIALLDNMDGQKSVQELLSAVPDRQEAAGFLHFLQQFAMIRLCPHPEAEASPDFAQKTLFNRPLEELGISVETTIGFEDLVEEVTDNVVLAMENSDLAAPLSEENINFEQAVQREYSLIKGKDYYVIFGMTPAKFSFNALKGAYFAKMKEYSPERFMELSGTTSSMAQEILSIYSDAYNTLSNVVAKERYDEMLNADKTLGIDGQQDGRLHARIQFQSGQVFLEMGEFENAEKALQESYTLEPDNAGHAAFLAWAIYRNSANRNSKTAQERARSLLTKSLQIEKSAEAFSFRGWMLLDEGRDGLAEGDFLKALKINPKEANARNGLKMIAEKREGEKKGIIRRFFT